MGGAHLQVRSCVLGDVPTSRTYLGNGWTDCAEIWCVVRDYLARRFTTVKGGVQQQHVRTCAPIPGISGRAGRIALKSDVCLEDRYQFVLHVS